MEKSWKKQMTAGILLILAAILLRNRPEKEN